jgi:hypothetical protein
MGLDSSLYFLPCYSFYTFPAAMKGNINIRRHGRHQDAILLMAVCEMMREYKKGKEQALLP